MFGGDGLSATMLNVLPQGAAIFWWWCSWLREKLLRGYRHFVDNNITDGYVMLVKLWRNCYEISLIIDFDVDSINKIN